MISFAQFRSKLKESMADMSAMLSNRSLVALVDKSKYHMAQPGEHHVHIANRLNYKNLHDAMDKGHMVRVSTTKDSQGLSHHFVQTYNHPKSISTAITHLYKENGHDQYHVDVSDASAKTFKNKSDALAHLKKYKSIKESFLNEGRFWIKPNGHFHPVTGTQFHGGIEVVRELEPRALKLSTHADREKHLKNKGYVRGEYDSNRLALDLKHSNPTALKNAKETIQMLHPNMVHLTLNRHSQHFDNHQKALAYLSNSSK